jgi:hypothetical protein
MLCVSTETQVITSGKLGPTNDPVLVRLELDRILEGRGDSRNDGDSGYRLIDLVRKWEAKVSVGNLPFPPPKFAAHFRTDRKVVDVVATAADRSVRWPQCA